METNKSIKRELNLDLLVNSANMLKAMAHPLRIAILELLDEREMLSVTDIYKKLGIEQAVASHHLSILRNKGILAANRDGKKIYYSLKYDRLSQILECLEKCNREPG